MPTCPNCRKENRENAFFCRHCGTAFQSLCPSCGEANLLDAVFCDRCGTGLSQETPAVTAAQAEKADSGPRASTGADGTYTPRHVQELVSRPASLQGERKEVAVLFADVSGFTSLSEKLDAEEVHAVMNGCFDILTSEVHRFGGTVNQYTGDGVMALFGAPKALETSPRDAIRAALAVQDRLLRYETKLEEEQGIKFRLRIGLNSGEVVVGAIGNDLRLDYTAMGDTTNVAARLEAAAEPGEILVSEYLYRLTSDWFRFEDRGEQNFKGKSKPIRAYRVLGLSGVSTRLEASSLRGLLTLRERDDVLGSLLRAYTSVEKRRGQIVALSGEAGIGKSRLVYELNKTLEKRESNVPLFMYAEAVHYDKDTPLSFLHLILKRYAELTGAYCAVDELGGEAIWREMFMDRASEVLGGEEKTRILACVTGQMDREKGITPSDLQSAFEALRMLFVLESRERPLVFTVDNLKEADHSSIEFLNSIVGGVSGARIFFLPVFRPGFEHPWGSKSNFHRITLQPLSRQASEEMIEEILGGPVSKEVLEVVFSRAEGNPFFTEEVVRSIRESGTILNQSGSWEMQRREEDIVLPRTVQDFVLARIDSLPSGLREVLQVASVIGPQFEFSLLERLCPHIDDLEARLSRLQEMDLAGPVGVGLRGEWGFTNRLIQELSYKEMLRSRSASLHGRVGVAIEAQGPETIEGNLSRLAYHFQRSNELDRAAHYLIRAGRRAYDLMALPQAAAQLEQGLIFMESLGEEEAEKLLSERIRVRGDLALALLTIATDEQRTESLVEEMREMAESTGDLAQVAMAHIHMCTLRFRQGDQNSVIDHAKRAIEMAEKSDAFEPLFRGRSALASAYRLTGRLRESIQEALEAMAIYERHLADRIAASSDIDNVVTENACSLGLAHALRGELPEAENWFQRAGELAENSQSPSAKVMAQYFAQILFDMRGQWAETEARVKAMMEKIKDIDSPFAWSGMRVYLGLAKVRQGEAEEGIALAQEALEARLRIGQKLLVAFCFYTKGEGLRLLGRWEEALEACRSGQEYARELGEEIIEMQLQELAALIRCDSAAEEGGFNGRIQEYEEALNRYEASELIPYLMRGRRRLAHFVRQSGDEKRASEMEEAATAYLRSIQAVDADGDIAIPAPAAKEPS
jgi:class 3 adenylate cyclase/predicted ATPase